jgi:hypothetical protein
MTFGQRRMVLGTVGMVLSWLWLAGAFLTAKKRSRSEPPQEAASLRWVEQHAR